MKSMLQRRVRMVALMAPLAVLLAGCAPLPVTVEQAARKLESVAVCCKTPSEFSYSSLSLRDRDSGYLNADSPVYDFGRGKAFFCAYTLPADGRSFTFYSPVGGFLPTAAFIDPVIAFLDVNHELILVQSQLPLKFGYHGLFNDQHYETTVPIPSAARYVAISSDPTSQRTARAHSANGREFTIGPRIIGPVMLEVR